MNEYLLKKRILQIVKTKKCLLKELIHDCLIRIFEEKVDKQTDMLNAG